MDDKEPEPGQNGEYRIVYSKSDTCGDQAAAPQALARVLLEKKPASGQAERPEEDTYLTQLLHDYMNEPQV